jgi:hypothetical protein
MIRFTKPGLRVDRIRSSDFRTAVCRQRLDANLCHGKVEVNLQKCYRLLDLPHMLIKSRRAPPHRVG